MIFLQFLQFRFFLSVGVPYARSRSWRLTSLSVQQKAGAVNSVNDGGGSAHKSGHSQSIHKIAFDEFHGAGAIL